jgi:hypothetical protein
MGLDALPLLIAQPKQVPPHDPDPPKRIRSVWIRIASPQH